MTVYAGLKNISVGAGTLYWAQLGTSEPQSATGAMPTGWTPFGYTEQGSTFAYTTQVSGITPEEEFDPIGNYVTSRTSSMTFNMLEGTAQNIALALNLGGGTIPNTATGQTGTLTDGTIYLEPPDPGSEQRIMLCWDSASEGAAPIVASDIGRILIRQAYQTGSISVARRKAPNESTYSVTFTGEKPQTGLRIFRWYFPARIAS